MSETVAVKLTDEQWEKKAEALAYAEVERGEIQDELDTAAATWKDDKERFNKRLNVQDEVIAKLAREVKTRTELQDAQMSIETDDNQAAAPA